MEISLYYTAYRDTPLTPEERVAVQGIDDRYSPDPLIEFLSLDPLEPPERLNFYDLGEDRPGDPRVILQGSTGLPRQMFALYDLEEGTINYWLSALGEIRQMVPGAEWEIHIDDFEHFVWDEAAEKYVHFEPPPTDHIDFYPSQDT